MARVLFTVTYTVNESAKERYLELVKQLKEKLRTGDVSYDVYSLKGRPNGFKEVFVYNSEAAFDDADDTAERTGADLLVKEISDMTTDMNFYVGYELV